MYLLLVMENKLFGKRLQVWQEFMYANISSRAVEITVCIVDIIFMVKMFQYHRRNLNCSFRTVRLDNLAFVAIRGPVVGALLNHDAEGNKCLLGQSFEGY